MVDDFIKAQNMESIERQRITHAEAALSNYKKTIDDALSMSGPARNKILIHEGMVQDIAFLKRMKKKYPLESKEIQEEWLMKWRNIKALVERTHTLEDGMIIVMRGLSIMRLFLPGLQSVGFTPDAQEVMRKRRAQDILTKVRSSLNPTCADLFIQPTHANSSEPVECP